MSIATKSPKSWASPPFDIKAPGIYLPMWRPSSDMTGSTVYSYDSNRHAGTVTLATWGRQGRTFDGSTAVISVPDHADLDLSTGAYSICLWFNPLNGFSAGVGYERLLQKWITNTGFLFIHPDNGTIDFQGDTAVVTFSPTSYTAGQWYCIGITANQADDTQRCFLNGALDTVGVGYIIITASTADLTIGGRVTPTTQQFTGTIGEVWLFNRTLSDADMARLYQSTKWRYTS